MDQRMLEQHLFFPIPLSLSEFRWEPFVQSVLKPLLAVPLLSVDRLVVVRVLQIPNPPSAYHNRYHLHEALLSFFSCKGWAS